MRLLLTIFLFPITFYGQVAIGSSTPVNSNVILDLTNFENRGLLLNKTNPGPTAPLGNIFYNNRKNMIGVVCDTLDSIISINYLSPWKHLDTNSDVTFTSDAGKVIIKNSIATPAVPPRVILEVENGSINVKKGKVKEGGHDLVPAGCIMMWAGKTIPIPDGWFLCDGALKNKADFPDLFAAIGISYGGSVSTFNLPNFNDKFPKGNDTTNSSVGNTGGHSSHDFAIAKGNLPSHTHSITHKHKDSISDSAGKHTHGTAGKHTHDTNIDYGGGGAASDWGAGSTYNAAANTVNTSEASGHDHGEAGGHVHGVKTPKYTGDSDDNSAEFKSNSITIPTEPPFLSIKFIIKY
jgi:microcystin-dependent protein